MCLLNNCLTAHQLLIVIITCSDHLMPVWIVQQLMYPVDEILRRQDRGVVNGPALADKMKSTYFTREERIFLVKVLGKYLMSNCDV
jgi:hypothetical protein